MKSSGPVFTRQNPFPPASTVRRTHYHPSRNQALSKKEKKITLSPVRLSQKSSPQQCRKSDRRFSTTDGQPVFEECWPSSDCELSPGTTTTSPVMETPKQSARPGKSTVSSSQGVQQDSVLAKYIERFRHGQPQSREDRQQMACATGEELESFWWMSPSSSPPSSTPIKTTDKDDHDPAIFSPAGQRRRDRSFSPCRGSLSILSDTSQSEFDDTEILQLQEKASRLLLRGECPLGDGSVPVSSEGLGCSDFSSPVSVDEPVQQPLIPSLIASTTGNVFTVKASSHPVHTVSSQKSFIPPLRPPTRPEDDILFQWRLRRKMEQARERPQFLQPSTLHGSTFSWQAPGLSHPSASGQAYKNTPPPQSLQRDTHAHVAAPEPETEETNRPRPPDPDHLPFPAFVASGCSASQPHTVAHVPAHMHFLCDVLPCPSQTSHVRAKQSIPQRSDEPQTKVANKKTQVSENYTNIFSNVPPGEHVSTSLPASSGAIEEERLSHQKLSERNKKKKAEKKTSESIRQQKKSASSSSHQRLPKKVTSRKEQHRQEGSQEFPSEGCTRDHEPPPSPIRTALGQVVSEVLFPVEDSSPAQRIPVSSDSPPVTTSAPSQSPVPPCNAQNSMEVISQLLQEAEDSDGKEFEDDPLLQVLRKQRKWVKEQISEVDSILNEFLEEQQVT
uniref:Proline and serine rich 3 n=1 Tax=Acanthochromis polyacanthus TaxID=80966 RepID=A0A3Q1GK08_9TELE